MHFGSIPSVQSVPFPLRDSYPFMHAHVTVVFSAKSKTHTVFSPHALRQSVAVCEIE